MSKILREASGFTLLEVLIALTIMMMAMTSILAVESGAIRASERTKQMNVVAMLARNKMIETEYKIEGKPFGEVKKEDAGQFDKPFEDYRWKVEIKEIEFPNLNLAGAEDGKDGKGGEQAQQGGTDLANMMARLVTKYLSKAIREVQISVLWDRSGAQQSFSVSTYWVDLNSDFQITE